MRGLISAINFLTVVPISQRRGRSEAELSASVRYFPLVGLILGLILAGFDRLLTKSLPPMASAAILITILTILTGAIHLDGLADTFDGIFGGRGDRKKSLEIMRGSEVGSFGAAAMTLDILLKVTLIASLSGKLRLAALILFPFVSRAVLVFSMVIFPCARRDGKAKSFSVHHDLKSLAAAAFLLTVAVWTNPSFIPAILAALFSSLLMAYLLSGRLGGLTGDVYGALVELSELFFLLFLVIGGGPWS